MGQAIGSVIDDNEQKHETDTVEQLQNLQRLVAAKLEAESTKLNKEAFEDPRLPILSVVNKTEKYSLKVESAPTEKIKECLENFVGGGYLDGVQNLLSIALGELLGNTAAGEQEKKEFHVVFASNSLLRIDCYMYSYKLRSKGLRDKFKNAFCYYMQVGVLDVMKVPPQILLYELTRSTGDADKLKQASQQLEEVAEFTQNLYNIVTSLRKAVTGNNGDLEHRKKREIESSEEVDGGRKKQKKTFQQEEDEEDEEQDEEGQTKDDFQYEENDDEAEGQGEEGQKKGFQHEEDDEESEGQKEN